MTLSAVLIQAIPLTLLFATPFLFAALGEVFVQRSGVLNLGVEGMMLMGAFIGIYVAAPSGLNQGPIIGLLAAMLTGGIMGLAMAFVSVTLQAEQGISGIGFTLFGQGLSSLLFRIMTGGVITADKNAFPAINLPILSSLPTLGKMFFQENILVYVAFALVPISIWVLNQTKWGLQIRACGQNPAAADSMGVNVVRVRYATLIFGGIMAGVAGASLSIAATPIFQENMTAGAGFIAVALVYFGGWSPFRVMLGALLFSIANNLQIWAQLLNVKIAGSVIPPNLLIMVPYVLTIAVLVFARQRRRTEPAALTKPFQRGEN
ncbi:MAG TPA: ABC transporter permease [Phototrophicaceae bacterium]|nr:ABC transporter permease [Phototrophicaceae bacterium]